MKKDLLWTAFWIVSALCFGAGIYAFRGLDDCLKFFTGYLIEKSLSIDNLFLFIVIFDYFRTPPRYKRKVLFWGILGAIVMRGLFIVGGLALISRFHEILYLFGLFLVFIGLKMFFKKDEEIHPERNPVLLLIKKLIPISSDYVNGHFFVRQGSKLLATPLFIVLLIVETTDIVFAIDSIPAIFAVTTDPLLVYSSNILAILGLRSLYFVLARFMPLFHFLHYGLGAILLFIGVKMLIADRVEVPVIFSLLFIAVSISLSIGASLLFPKNK